MECDYESGSKLGKMGSIEESREWDGVVMEPVISQDQYSLNDAVFMNEDG